MAYNIELIEYGTNQHIVDIELAVIPRVGEYFVMDTEIGADWQNKFYIIRGVTYTLTSQIKIHIEKQDMKKIKDTEDRFNELMNKMGQKFNRMDI